jgi:hypothetical protein
VAFVAERTVTGQFTSGRLARAVCGHLVLATGARSAIAIDRLDELCMAVDLVLARSVPPVTVAVTAGPDWLSVAVDPADAGWLDQNGSLLGSMVEDVQMHGTGVKLRAG